MDKHHAGHYLCPAARYDVRSRRKSQIKGKNEKDIEGLLYLKVSGEK